VSSIARLVLVLVALVALPVAASAVRAADGGVPAAAGRITIERTATVSGGTLRLGDIAFLEGGATALADLDLGPAPEPGASRRIEGVTILNRLRAAGLDERSTRYEIAASVRIERAAQEVGADEVRRAIDRQSQDLLAAGESIRSLDVPGPIRVPLGGYQLRVAAGGLSGRGARRRCDVEVVQEGEVIATIPVRAEIASIVKVVIARRALPRGERVTADDVVVEERELSAVPADFVSEVAEVTGKETRMALVASAPVPLQALASPVLVKRGDLVNMIAEGPGLRLSAAGEALETGTLGAQIRVRNRQSKQELSAQVVERGTVAVRY